MIARSIENIISQKLFKDKAIVLIGARQTGKTTSIMNIIRSQQNVLELDGDDRIIRNLLNEPGTEEIRNIIGNHKVIFIDEVQRINNIGLTAKIIVD